MRDIIVRGIPRTTIPWLVILGAILALVSALTLLAAPVGYNTGVLPLRTALITLLTWSAYGGVAAAVVSLSGLVLALRRPRSERRGVWLATASMLIGVTLVAVPGRFRMGPPTPPIHDISTDTQDPPQFVAVLPLRVNAPNPTQYGGEKIASQQRAAYPDIQPLILNIPPAQAFERALAAVHEMGWQLVAADPATGRIEATDTTFWFRFKDDVVIRIRPTQGGGSRIDVRSLSRLGVGDVGTNAKRIRAYLAVLRASRP